MWRGGRKAETRRTDAPATFAGPRRPLVVIAGRGQPAAVPPGSSPGSLASSFLLWSPLSLTLIRPLSCPRLWDLCPPPARPQRRVQALPTLLGTNPAQATGQLNAQDAPPLRRQSPRRTLVPWLLYVSQLRPLLPASSHRLLLLALREFGAGAEKEPSQGMEVSSAPCCHLAKGVLTLPLKSSCGCPRRAG